jgi:hypothetical protein
VTDVGVTCFHILARQGGECNGLVATPLAKYQQMVLYHTPTSAPSGEDLGAMWGEEKTREYLQLAGFRTIEPHQLAYDMQNNRYVVRK